MNIYDNRIYRSLHPKLQEMVISMRALVRRALRHNHLTWRILSELQKNQWLSSSEIELYQMRKLREVLKIAEETVPYYQNLFKKIGFYWEDLKRPEDISELPTLTKETLRKNYEQFIPTTFRRLSSVSGQTSGTTGSPVKIYHDLGSIIKEQAFFYRQKKWAGFKKGERSIWLRGDLIVPADQRVPPFWRYNLTDKQLIMSSYHLSTDTLPCYIEKINRFCPALILSYPSSIFTIASFMKNNGYEPIPVKCIITSSETLFPEQKEIIEEMFECKVYDWYGSYERVAAIGTCEYGKYHIIEDYGYTELLDYNGPIKEIVSTGFNNLLVPLIRYKTGDLVQYFENSQLCPCGRQFRKVNSILGREDDYIVLSNGRKVQRLDFVFKDELPIREAQIYQYKDYTVEIRVVPDKGFNSRHEQKLLYNARSRLGREVSLKIKLCRKISRTKSGKLKMVISELSNY